MPLIMLLAAGMACVSLYLAHPSDGAAGAAD